MKPYGININASFIESDEGCEFAVKMDDSNGLKLAKRVKGQEPEKCIEAMYAVLVKDMITNRLKEDNHNCEEGCCGKCVHQDKSDPHTSQPNGRKVYSIFDLF